MAGKRKQQSKLNWTVILLVSAVAAFFILRSIEDKHGFELGMPEVDLPSSDILQEFVDDFLAQGKDREQAGSQGYMDNAMSVSAPVQGEGVTVTILDMEQADSILIQGSERTVLIDCGENGWGGNILHSLDVREIAEIDLLIGTHPHSDHIGGMDDVILGIPVGELLMPDLPDALIPTTRTFTDLLDAVEEMDVPVRLAEPGWQYPLGDGAVLTILGPLGSYADLNNCSVICRVDYGDTAFLFCGDASAEAEADLVAAARLEADLLVVPHHGSSSSSSEAFLDAVFPSIAVISCGLDNSYGHPHREVMDRLREREIEVLRTDLMEEITVHSDGESLYILPAA